jgi:hypothetical protein
MPLSTAVKAGYFTRYDGMTFDLATSSLQLVSLLIADKHLKKLYHQYDLPHLEHVSAEFRESEIIRLMVEIATQYRLMDWGVASTNRSKHYKVGVVGALSVDGVPGAQDLTMREACNKIIHAQEIAFDVTKVRKQNDHFFNPVIHVRGEKGKVGWEASIDIVWFCNAANQPIQKLLIE